MTPKFNETDVKVVFYRAYKRRGIATRAYQLFSCQKISHVGLLLKQEDREYIIATNKVRGMCIIPSSHYNIVLDVSKFPITKEHLDLGKSYVSLYQMACFVDNPEFLLSSLKENILWWLLGRHLSDTYKPMTCALAISYLLKMCGYDVQLHVCPHTLYKELLNGVNNHFRTSEIGQDNFGKPISP